MTEGEEKEAFVCQLARPKRQLPTKDIVGDLFTLHTSIHQYKTQLLVQRKREVIYSEPHVGNYVPGTWIPIALRVKVCVGRGYTDSYNHRTKRTHKSVYLPHILVGISRRYIIEDQEFLLQVLDVTAFIAFGLMGAHHLPKALSV